MAAIGDSRLNETLPTRLLVLKCHSPKRRPAKLHSAIGEVSGNHRSCITAFLFSYIEVIFKIL